MHPRKVHHWPAPLQRPVHGFSVRNEKGDHLSISGFMESPVERLADDEEWPDIRLRLPSCPGARVFAESRHDSESVHQRAVEGKSPLEVAGADKYVGEHWLLAKVGTTRLDFVKRRRMSAMTPKIGKGPADGLGDAAQR